MNEKGISRSIVLPKPRYNPLHSPSVLYASTIIRSALLLNCPFNVWRRCLAISTGTRTRQATCGYIVYFFIKHIIVQTWIGVYSKFYYQFGYRCRGHMNEWRILWLFIRVFPKIVFHAFVRAKEKCGCWHASECGRRQPVVDSPKTARFQEATFTLYARFDRVNGKQHNVNHKSSDATRLEKFEIISF